MLSMEAGKLDSIIVVHHATYMDFHIYILSLSLVLALGFQLNVCPMDVLVI